MLARLLRRLLLSQAVAGALLGGWLWRQTGASFWFVAIFAIGLPLTVAGIVILTTAIKSRAPGAPAAWWRSVVSECLTGIRVFMLMQPWAKGTPTVQRELSTGVASRVPVVLVHGYICNHRVWDRMVAHLRRAGHPVLAIDLEPLFASIDDYAPLLDRAVAELSHQTGATRVALVGHSMGGLAIRAWLRVHGTAHVATVITLGSPHAGTQLDPHPKTPNGQQMAWGSRWLQDLATSETNATRSLMHIGLTPQDNIVYPQRDQVLPGVPVTVFDGRGHLELCLDQAVMDWVTQVLEACSSPDN